MDALAAAHAFVALNFPTARAAVLAGSAARGEATETSDLDIVVVLDGPPAPYRETLRFHDWLIELFAHTKRSLHEFYERDARSRRCPLASMCASGVPLAGEDCNAVQADAAAFLSAGPPPVDAAELAQRRYFLTDALDDLLGGHDHNERAVVAAQVLVGAAELALVVDGRWLGSGKWLLRRLQDARPETAQQLVGAYRQAVGTGDAQALGLVCEAILADAGGRLSAGFRPAGLTGLSPR